MQMQTQRPIRRLRDSGTGTQTLRRIYKDKYTPTQIHKVRSMASEMQSQICKDAYADAGTDHKQTESDADMQRHRHLDADA